MENINFDKIIERKNTNCIKWDNLEQIFGKENITPMWVADMDFKSSNDIIKALSKRTEHGIFGYTKTSDEYYDVFINWIYKKHKWKIDKNWISYVPGVVPGLKLAIYTYTKEKDNILIQTPVYYPFFNVIKNLNRNIVTNPLIYSDNIYSIDFKDLENKIKQYDVKMMILCNPHNPIGKVWSKDDLIKISNICIDNDVLLISDEIHSDLIYENNKHEPIANLNNNIKENSITFYSPSKTFNIAGLQASNAIIPNEYLKKQFDETIEKIGNSMINALSQEAFIAAYKHGELWLEYLIKYLKENINITIDFFNKEIPNSKIITPEGTYLLWINLKNIASEEEIKDILINKANIGLEEGSIFGEDGKGFFRMNIATPKEILLKSLKKIKTSFKNGGLI
ncbi:MULTISPECIES: MalY/PatB family protein [Oceanotoga]|jgi:cystathionine beta-lyase|uniref:cysteine-S-conjugate beta-lyase n=1 Tax=Oceanotoga teriensis TaxID=515440 RepID=A0AA45C5W1_9BACT|nr:MULTISPECIES: MalY/PatB family protein [Oceanotoga]MDN5341498.1 cysteine-S-conjugate beta-lyase [Oceanotoga sp.]MDO7977703.1 pyridoxal phosphate-dependent aminotransferase [Oceanotoga teriensis]PWJ90045.1 cystathionine beta-lyase [Oceanotoga teriensis]